MRMIKVISLKMLCIDVVLDVSMYKLLYVDTAHNADIT